jgi:hypothetical protein
MSHSRTGLNAPFYEWIDDVRRAFRKEKELLGKLEYYNVKFIGYKGINYGQIITNPMPSNDKDMLYWLDKIDEVNKKIKINKLVIIEFNTMFFNSNTEGRSVLNLLVNSCTFKENRVKNSKYFKTINQLCRDLINIRKQ